MASHVKRAMPGSEQLLPKRRTPPPREQYRVCRRQPLSLLHRRRGGRPGRHERRGHLLHPSTPNRLRPASRSFARLLSQRCQQQRRRAIYNGMPPDRRHAGARQRRGVRKAELVEHQLHQRPPLRCSQPDYRSAWQRCRRPWQRQQWGISPRSTAGLEITRVSFGSEHLTREQTNVWSSSP